MHFRSYWTDFNQILYVAVAILEGVGVRKFSVQFLALFENFFRVKWYAKMMSTDVDCHSVGSQGKIEFCLPKVKCHFITILSKPELAMISSVIPAARKEALSACVHPSAIVRRKSRSLAAFFSCSLSLSLSPFFFRFFGVLSSKAMCYYWNYWKRYYWKREIFEILQFSIQKTWWTSSSDGAWKTVLFFLQLATHI